MIRPISTSAAARLPWPLWARPLVLALAVSMAGCAAPTAPAGKIVYDFGPANTAQVPAEASTASSRSKTPLVLFDVQGNSALSNVAVQYRLNYANAQELRPYSLARWSVSPTLLVEQRVRSALNTLGPVLAAGDGHGGAALKLELVEFSQHFSAPESSQGVVVLRASLFKNGQLHAQTNFEAQSSAPSANASGGVNAMSAATQIVAEKLTRWVEANSP